MRTIYSLFYYLPVLGMLSCATQEVKQQLDDGVKQKGEVFAQEIEAQSPFKKVRLSWNEASELMKERNLAYRNAVIKQEVANDKGSYLGNLTSEMKTSLKSTATVSLNPKELAKLLNNPMANLPKQLSSLSGIKDVSHNLQQKEWGRVETNVDAESEVRKEKVKLHVLFHQYTLLEKKRKLLDSMESGEEVDSSLERQLKRDRLAYDKQRTLWLREVRNFFDAEYFDVEFSAYSKKLPLYRGVKDPEFTKWQRWRLLDHSKDLAVALKSQHKKNKPAIPGTKTLMSKLGVSSVDEAIVTDRNDSGLRKEVRGLLKNWRELKEVQTDISLAKRELALVKAEAGDSEKESEVDLLKQQLNLISLEEKEVKLASHFWQSDEKCWK